MREFLETLGRVVLILVSVTLISAVMVAAVILLVDFGIEVFNAIG